MDANFFERGDPATRTALYLRILYGKDYLERARLLSSDGQGLPELTRQFLKSIDFRIMELEQAARARNLGRHVLRAAPALQHVMDTKLFDALIAEFTNSDVFWQAAGRSLAENFCFFAHREAHVRLTPFQKDTLKACGIVAGISVTRQSESPWIYAGEASKLGEDNSHTAGESFVSKFRLIDEDGGLADEKNLVTVQAEITSRVFIQRPSENQVVAHSVPL